MGRSTVLAAIFVLACAPAHAQSSSRGTGGHVVWTVVGAGAGFSVGLWAGLTAFDDAVNSDRKVWTSAAVGAAVGGVTSYLIGRARRDRARPAAIRTASTDGELDATLLGALARSVRFRHVRAVTLVDAAHAPWIQRQAAFPSEVRSVITGEHREVTASDGAERDSRAAPHAGLPNG